MTVDPLVYCLYKKHLHVLWTEVVEDDRRYVEWLISQDGPLLMPDDLYDMLVELLEDTDE